VLVERVASAARGDQALRVLVTSARTPSGEIALSLGRALAQQRPVILIDLASRAETRADQPPGLDALLMGVATFDEAIHLDDVSRLHRLTCGLQETRPGSALDIVLQALANTYDVVILAVPSLAEGDLATGLATDVDVTVLACPGSASDPASSAAYRDLKTAGAGTIFAFSHESAPELRRDRQALYQRPSIHLMSGMTGSTQPSPATT
jgi:Mrp family chromosome partitioning ATPase